MEAREGLRISAAVWGGLALALTAGPAAGFDGVTEINQVMALAGGVTPGDAPGFPVTIDQSGSYRLTGNLAVPADTIAILVDETASNVTLDLGGFQVRGPNICHGEPVAKCNSTGGDPGIASSAYATVVRNGSVVGMSGPCILLRALSAVVEKTNVYYCGDDGIRVEGDGRVVQSRSGYNAGAGIRADVATTIERSHAYFNGSAGIVAAGLVTKNVTRSNGGGEISVGTGGASTGDNLCAGTPC